jgi:hypothetical protein
MQALREKRQTKTMIISLSPATPTQPHASCDLSTISLRRPCSWAMGAQRIANLKTQEGPELNEAQIELKRLDTTFVVSRDYCTTLRAQML